jgi:hypothetical protein
MVIKLVPHPTLSARREYCPHVGMWMVRQQYIVPEDQRKHVDSEGTFQIPDGHLYDKAFVEVRPDYSAEINTMRNIRHTIAAAVPTRSPFAIAPHIKSGICPVYESFMPGTKLSNEFKTAWAKPGVSNVKERIAFLMTIGGDELVRQYQAPHDAHTTTSYCLWCFQDNYMQAYQRHQSAAKEVEEAKVAAAAAKTKEETRLWSSIVTLRMIVNPTFDYESALINLFRQNLFPVSRWAYAKVSDTEVRAIYQTEAKNIIKAQIVGRYIKVEYTQSKCMTVDDVADILGRAGVKQHGDWDND